MNIHEFTGNGIVGATLLQRGYIMSPNSDGVIADSDGTNSPNEVIVRAIPDEMPFFKIDPQGYVKQSDVDAMLISANVVSGMGNFVLVQHRDVTNQMIQEGDYILVGDSHGIGEGFTGLNQEIIKITDITSYDTNTGLLTVAHSKRGCFGTTDANHPLGSKMGRYVRGFHADFFSMIKSLNGQLRIGSLIDVNGRDLVTESGQSYISIGKGNEIVGKFKEFKRYEDYNVAYAHCLIYK